MGVLYNIKGFPFAKSSAEEERSYLNEIYYKQQYYDSLVDLAEISASRFILGQRGIGKSATILQLIEDMKSVGILPVLIDQYDGFLDKGNKRFFIYTMIYKLVFELAEHTMVNHDLLKKLNSTQKQQLGLYIEMFYDPMTAAHCIESAEAIYKKKSRNRIRSFINQHLSLINNLIGVSVKIGSDLILSAMRLDKVNTSELGREYIQEFKLLSYKQIPRSIIVSWDVTRLKSILYNLRDMAIAMGYKSVVMMFDKIDEISRLNGQIDKVTKFMTDFLSDTSLLYSDNIAIIVSLWSEVKGALNMRGIRFDKFKEIDIRWTNDELIELLDKRLFYFSIDKSAPVTFHTLLPNANDYDTVIRLADKSPRALFDVLERITEEEKQVEPIKQFSSSAISKGILMYCKKYDYTSAQPTRVGKGTSVADWIVRLLRLKLQRFSHEQYMDINGITKKVALSHIETLLKYNLIKDSLYTTENGSTIYEIADPRISHLISRGEITLDI